MGQKLTAFRPIKDLQGLMVADNGSLRCTAIQLSGGDLCLFNPVKGLDSTTLESLRRLGKVKYLLTPNHYHNRALQEYSDNFSKAALCASKGARPRLQKVSGLKFANLTGLKRKLPEHIELIQTGGLKTGELWLRVKGRDGVCWLVGDAFCGSECSAKGIFSAAPKLLKTFPKYGVGDRHGYIEWVKIQLTKDQPTTIIPCHGTMLRSKQLAKKLEVLITENI